MGRNDPCPCGSRRLFQGLLPCQGQVLMASTVMTTIAEHIRATLSWSVALFVACRRP
ncbi:SEC-C metal-binding domain-containing protein [Luteimonas soli]|uniref:SEC-C metal-binding domain-containing protein n=1 Tax=Luteimonas soli TaxID=1648966 RepID=A0ABV7XRL7_9GAMM